FLRKNGIEFVIDSSNRENIYLRNRVRNTLMPILAKEYNPGIVQSLVHTSEILRKEDEFLDRIASDLFSKVCVSGEKQSVTLDVIHLRNLDESMQTRIVQKAIKSCLGDLNRVTYEHLESIAGILSGRGANKYLNLPRGLVVEKRYNELVIGKKAGEISFHYSFSKIPHLVNLKEIDKKVEFKIIPRNEHVNLSVDRKVAFMDYGQVKFPIVIRNFREGDRFQPMGLKGTKKLKDLFIDSKIPKSFRRKIPLLVFDDLIAWVIGLRIDHRVMVRDCTREILEVRML
ncbi:MAG: tRNA lysidine(34) synthetase TilS, partial [Pseudomonadota bacterium]